MSWYHRQNKRNSVSRKSAGSAAPPKKAFGSSWWGQQWLQALAQIDFANALPAGRALAVTGAVGSVQVSENLIFASVEDAAIRQTYDVTIKFPTFNAEQREKLLHIINNNPAIQAKIVAGDLPPELVSECRKVGIHIFPRSWHDYDLKCTCPDWAVPCKHMAATFYPVANEIDKNSFLVFELHGMKLSAAYGPPPKASKAPKEVAEKAPAESAVAPETVVTPAGNLQQESPAESTIAPEVATPVSNLWQESPDWSGPDFAFDESALAEINLADLPDCGADLLADLPEGPAQKALRALHEAVAAGVVRHAVSNESLSKSVQTAIAAAENAMLLLDDQGRFLVAQLLDSDGDPTLTCEDMESLHRLLKSVTTAQAAGFAPEIRGMHLAFRLAERLAFRRAFVPQRLSTGDDNQAIMRYLPAVQHPAVQGIFDKISPLLPPRIVFYDTENGVLVAAPADAPLALVAVFLNYFVEKYVSET